jgi:hypothetical protein
VQANALVTAPSFAGSLRLAAARNKSLNVLAEEELNRLLLKIQAQFGWRTPAPQFRLVSVQGTRTATLYRCRPQGVESAEPSEVVVKVGYRWRAETVRNRYAQMIRLLRVWPDQHNVRIVPPLGWDSKPPCICMPYVIGTNLSNWPLLSNKEEGRLAVVRCGEALGTFHSVFQPRKPDLRARSEANRNLERARRRMLLRLGAVTLEDSAISIAYGDFGPHNFLVDGRGQLHLLDLPRDEFFAPVHRDIGWYAARLEFLLAVSHRGRDAGQVEDIRDLWEWFYEGYVRTGPIDVRSRDNRDLIAIYRGYRASSIAYKEWRKKRYGRAVKQTARWVACLRDLHMKRSRNS